MNPYTDTAHVNSQAGEENKLYSQIKLYMYQGRLCTRAINERQGMTCMSTQTLQKKKKTIEMCLSLKFCVHCHTRIENIADSFFYISLLISLPLLNIQA